MDVIHRESFNACIECDGAWWVQGTDVSCAEHSDGADGDLDARHTSCDEEGKLSRHIAPCFESKGRDKLSSSFIIVVIISGF